MSDHYTVDTAAARLGLSSKTVRRYIKDGKLPAYRLGPTLIRLRIEDVEAFADGCPLVPEES